MKEKGLQAALVSLDRENRRLNRENHELKKEIHRLKKLLKRKTATENQLS